jgi:hypothetical protein
MNKLALALMVLGLVVVGLAGGYYASSDSPARCLDERRQAVDFAQQATAAGEGTPEAAELMDKSREASDWADGSCAAADGMKQQSLGIAAAGVLMLVIGLVLKVRGSKAPTG